MTEQLSKATVSRCVFCPAGCELHLVATGPDRYRSDFPLDDSGGLCPRGSALGDLVSHPRRILWPSRREGANRETIGLSETARGVIQAAGSKEIVILLDAGVPVEQMVAAAEWCKAWERATLCLLCEPADRQMLLGVEAAGARYLSEEALEQCDGFLIIGDAFAANPMCSRGVFRRRTVEPRTPIVVVDAAAGTASRFATCRVDVAPGMEPAALLTIAQTAGTRLDVPMSVPPEEMPSAVAAGKALAGCRNLGVLIAAEYGRSAQWRAIGYAASVLAKDRGGGVAPQIGGANALAAVRLAEGLGAVSPAQALAREDVLRIAVGCDVLGMLGWDAGIAAAAAGLPNATTAAADWAFPLTLPGEIGGTFLLSGDRKETVSPIIRPPAGVPCPADLVGALARADGVSRPSPAAEVDCTRRATPARPAFEACADPDAALMFCRQAMHDGCGWLTRHAAWQASCQPQPEVCLSSARAAESSVSEFGEATVRAGQRSFRGRVRLDVSLRKGAVLVPQGSTVTRALAPCRADPKSDTVRPDAVVAEVSS